MKFVLASQNKHKLVEMQSILSAHGVEVVLESEIGLHLNVEETGSTFAENAMIKARAVMEASGLPVSSTSKWRPISDSSTTSTPWADKMDCISTNLCLFCDARTNFMSRSAS